LLYIGRLKFQYVNVEVVTIQEGRAKAPSYPRDSGTRPVSALEAAIERSQNYLLGEQKPEGYWVGELLVDATLVADTIAYHHWNGKVDERWQRKAVNHIFSMQLPDGGWNIY
jgi:squalene-hopene/tetraprenyl-beta-curcumene cyclase